MVQPIKCPGCQAILRVRADMAGKQVKCPRCARAVSVPARGGIPEKARPAPTQVATVEPLPDEEEEQIRVKKPGSKKSVREEPPQEEEIRVKRPGVKKPVPEEPPEDVEETEEEAPDEPRSPFLPCPRCGAEESKRILFTYWGSFYFTALFAHVGCPACGYTYNGRTGRSNIVPAVVCFNVALIGLLGALGFIAWFVHRQGWW